MTVCHQPRRHSKVDAILGAAETGDKDAQLRLGHCYQLGKGVVQDKREAVRWFAAAAEQGYAPAQYCLALCLEQGGAEVSGINTQPAVVWYERAALQGHMKAQNNLAVCYEEAGQYLEAVKWYERAAKQGHVRSQHNLALCYDDAKGVVRDTAKAAHFYHQAALQGYAKAQAALGQCYAQGIGVSADPKEAQSWYRAAAQQGHQGAREWLAATQASALPSPINMTDVIDSSGTANVPEWFVDDSGNADGWL